MHCVQSLDPDLEAELGRIKDTAPRYGLWTKFKVHVHVHVHVLVLFPDPVLKS